jgi:hypothetical protein
MGGRKAGHFVPGKKVPAFIYDSPGTLERGTQLSLLAVKGKYPDESSSLSFSLIGSWNTEKDSTFHRCPKVWNVSYSWTQPTLLALAQSDSRTNKRELLEVVSSRKISDTLVGSAY